MRCYFHIYKFKNDYRKPVRCVASLLHPYRVSFIQKELCCLDSSLQKEVKIKGEVNIMPDAHSNIQKKVSLFSTMRHMNKLQTALRGLRIMNILIKKLRPTLKVLVGIVKRRNRHQNSNQRDLNLGGAVQLHSCGHIPPIGSVPYHQRKKSMIPLVLYTHHAV
jgi:hypothetical protein